MRICMCVYEQARSVAIYRRAATIIAILANVAKCQTEKLGYSNKRRRYANVKFTAVNSISSSKLLNGFRRPELFGRAETPRLGKPAVGYR